MHLSTNVNMPAQSLDPMQKSIGNGITRQMGPAMSQSSKGIFNILPMATVSGETERLQNTPTLRVKTWLLQEPEVNPRISTRLITVESFHGPGPERLIGCGADSCGGYSMHGSWPRRNKHCTNFQSVRTTRQPKLRPQANNTGKSGGQASISMLSSIYWM